MSWLLLIVTGRSDADLVRAFQGGDRDAFAEIVRRYQDRVLTVCVRWLGDPRVAEEVGQDVFLAIYRSLDRFRGDAQLSTFVYRVAINHCKNHRLYSKRRFRDQHEPLEGAPRDEDEPTRQIPSEDAGTDAFALRSEAAVLLQRGLDALDDEHRSVIVMRDVEDLSYEEISDILDLPRGTVKSRLHRARAQLAAVLGRWVGKEDVI